MKNNFHQSLRKISLLLFVLTGSFHLNTLAQTKLNTLKIKDNNALKAFFKHSADRIPLMCGHRGGAMKGFPENSISTFENTLKKMHAFFEVDPRLTKDSVIVVMHDATLDRTTTGKGKIADYTWAELQKLKLKDPEGNITKETIPLLKDVINWAKGKTVLMLDKKDVPFSMLLNLIEKEKAEDHILISSYEAEEAKYYYDRNKKLMFEAFISNEKKMLEYEKLGIPWCNIVAYLGQPRGQKLMDDLHERGVMCIIYTAKIIEKKEEKERLAIYPQLIKDGADILLADRIFEVEETIKSLKPSKSSKDKYFSKN